MGDPRMKELMDTLRAQPTFTACPEAGLKALFDAGARPPAWKARSSSLRAPSRCSSTTDASTAGISSGWPTTPRRGSRRQVVARASAAPPRSGIARPGRSGRSLRPTGRREQRSPWSSNPTRPIGWSSIPKQPARPGLRNATRNRGRRRHRRALEGHLRSGRPAGDGVPDGPAGAVRRGRRETARGLERLGAREVQRTAGLHQDRHGRGGRQGPHPRSGQGRPRRRGLGERHELRRPALGPVRLRSGRPCGPARTRSGSASPI